MNTKYIFLKERITEELPYVLHSISRAENAWQKVKQQTDDAFLDSVALNLHNMYSGLERIFEQIATNMDGFFPEGKKLA